MLVYIVEVQCPSRLDRPKQFFKFAIRVENEVFAIAKVSNRLRLHISMMAACYVADNQDDYSHIKPYAPLLIYAPGD